MIKSQERTRHTPVILLTALSGREDKIHGIEAGADDFITKPFDKGEVLARVKMLLNVKSLDDRLKSAYEDIVGMIDTAGRLIRAFDPSEFDLRSSVDAFVGPVLRRRDGDYAKPRVALVGFPREARGWSWREYRWEEEALRRVEASLGPSVEGLVTSEPRLLHFNGEDLKRPEAEWLLKTLDPVDLRPANAVCWLSQELCILLLDYGKEVGVFDATVLEGLVTQSLFLRSLALQVSEIENSFAYTVAALARAAEANDEDTGNHIQRVGECCAALAEEMGLPGDFVRAIRLQAQMHDVGKIHVHPDILKKSGDLDELEWAEMKKHTLYGALILGDHPRLQMARNVAISHHEKWDGSGYPFGLKGEDIPLEGRIIGIADVYDAIRSRRFYKPAVGHQETVEILTTGGGRTLPQHFDPKILDAFKSIHPLFEAIYERFSS
jgi:response regulator RpfG family c-di-GMP phosphodiesterase